MSYLRNDNDKSGCQLRTELSNLMINPRRVGIVDESYLPSQQQKLTKRNPKTRHQSCERVNVRTLRGGLSGAKASATNCGPSAEPPIPTDRI